VTHLELDNKARTQPTIRKPTLAGLFSSLFTVKLPKSRQADEDWLGEPKRPHNRLPRANGRRTQGTMIGWVASSTPAARTASHTTRV
jgi:hypothetical protein